MRFTLKSWRYDARTGHVHFEAACRRIGTRITAVSSISVLGAPKCEEEVKRLVTAKFAEMMERPHPTGQ